MAYITEGDLENFILQDIDSSFSTWIASVIDIVEDYIDNYCGTQFQNSASGDKYYDGNGTNELIIDPVQSVSALVFLNIDGNTMSTLSNSDYNLYPLNATAKNVIRLAQGGSWGSFPHYSRSVKVTGIWGYATVPNPVKMAGIQLCARMINEGLRGGQVSSENLGSYSVSYNKVDEIIESMGIKEILNQYRVLTLD